MTYCHEICLELWKKSRIFRVVVGGHIESRVQKDEKKVKKSLDFSFIFRILVL